MNGRKFFCILSVATLFLTAVSVTSCGNSYSGLENTAVLQSMTLEEKVGQLFVIRPDQLNTELPLDEVHDYKAPGEKELSAVMKETLKRYPSGGFVIFMKNLQDPEQLNILMRALKEACAVLPIMAIDEEGGISARIANHDKFDVPKCESMGAIGDTGDSRNAYEAGKTIGGYLKEYGFTLDLAPVADINTNPRNVVIGNRAFGSDPELVSRMVGAYLDGLHAQGIAGSVKHFPGHGDTIDDTHSGYVAVYKTWDELLKAEIIPFRDNLSKADAYTF